MSQDVPTPDQPGMSRRRLLRGAAGIGAATVAAGLMVDALATSASATQAPSGQAAEKHTPAGDPGGPLVAHVKDARTGEVDLFVGTRHVRFHDPEFAARLANAAR